MVMQYSIEDEAETRRQLINNIVVMSVALVVIAGMSVVAVAAVENNKNAPSTMLLQKLCQDSGYMDDCLQYLSNCKPQDKVATYLKVSLHKALQYMKDAVEPKDKNFDSMTPVQRAAVADCKEILLPLAMEELQQLIGLQNSTDKSLEKNHEDFRTGLSAAISYQQTCQDGLAATKIQNAYSENGDSTLSKPMKMAKITLSLVYEQSENLDRMKYDRIDKRRSLRGDDSTGNSQSSGATEDDYAFPPWFSATERNLLEVQGFTSQQPDVIVGKDGKSKYTKIMDAINAYPKDLNRPYVIYVREGKYEERIFINSSSTNIYMYGDGPDKTIVSGLVTAKADEITTFKMSTFTVVGRGFFCSDMGFAVPKGYETGAPLHVHSDKSAFFNCKITGKTTSLFAVANRQFYRNCEFISDAPVLKGNSAAVIQNSKISLLPPAQENVVSEQSRSDKRENTGFVIHNCSIDIMNSMQKSNQYSICLGRPQTNNSRTVVMESYLSNNVKPEGWCKGIADPSPMLLEYNNQGPGAATDKRVSWSRVMSKDEAQIYTPALFIEGNSWLKNSSIQYNPGLLSR